MLPNRFARWILISLTLLLAFAPVAPASAGGKPIRGPEPFNGPYLYTGDTAVCDFSVLLEAPVNNVYFKAFTYGSTTRYVITGVTKYRLTNVDGLNAGKSIGCDQIWLIIRQTSKHAYFPRLFQALFAAERYPNQLTLVTPKSIDVMGNAQAIEVGNSDGTFTISVHGPGVYVHLPGLPRLAYLRGNGTANFDAFFNPTAVTYVGNVQDLCAALQ